jgi:hypothetical protein
MTRLEKKEKILRAVKEKYQLTNKHIKIISDCSVVTLKA